MTTAHGGPIIAPLAASQQHQQHAMLRGLTRRWIMPCAATSQVDGATGASPDLPLLVQRVLAARGLQDPDAIRAFCEPRLTNLCDPTLMPGIDAAAARIIHALRANQHMVIYGDYDVDGITASAILYHIIKTIQPAARVQTYVPHRLDEGYGLNCDALRHLRAQGANLVITVDCGITAVRSAQTARDIGLDLIITDHHEFRPAAGDPSSRARTATTFAPDQPSSNDDLQYSFPSAVALVHPRLPGSQYPFGELCGAGVAFKLAWHLARVWCNSQRVSEQLQRMLLHMLPLVALGTIADVVPLVGENRVLTAMGLRLIKQSPLPGLRALIEASQLMDEKIDCERVGFVLAPRLNACGRMGHAAQAVCMLTDASPQEAVTIAQQLVQQNQHRQSVERTILDQAARLAEDGGMTRDDHRAIVLAHEAWHPGVVGIVCSRMVERFGRPVVLLQRSASLCKGSARSIDGYSIHDGLGASAQYLATYGGHAMAAGLSLDTQHLQPFSQALVAHANMCISIEQLTPSLRIDCEARLDEVMDFAAVQHLQRLAPFGRGNRAPAILVQHAIVAEPPRQIGANGRHLSLRVRQDAGSSAQRSLRTVWWSGGTHACDLAAGMRIDLVIEPRINVWNGHSSVEGEIRDLRILQR